LRGTATDEICADFCADHSDPVTGPDHPLPSRVASGHRRKAAQTKRDGFRSLFSRLNWLSGLVRVSPGRGRS
jgi:hypothetical protein